MTDGKKEQIKLRANYLNGIAVVFLSIGGLAPFFIAYQSLDWWKIFVSLGLLGLAGVSSWEIHRMAQNYLSKLDVASNDKQVADDAI